jgi:hypothetical protein
MDDFAIHSGPGGTVIAMARWEGGLLAGGAPAICSVVEGTGGVGVVQPYRNGLLLGVAAGPRADDVARGWRTRPWHAPAQLAEAARAGLDPGERLGMAVVAVSALDGRLAWLRAGAVGCVILRGVAAGIEDEEAPAAGRGGLALFPPAATALSRRGGGPLRAATIDVRRDDVLVLAALPLPPPALAALAQRGGHGPASPAFVTARFERGTLEPRRPAGVERRGGGPKDATTLEGP